MKLSPNFKRIALSMSAAFVFIANISSSRCMFFGWQEPKVPSSLLRKDLE